MHKNKNNEEQSTANKFLLQTDLGDHKHKLVQLFKSESGKYTLNYLLLDVNQSSSIWDHGDAKREEEMRRERGRDKERGREP